MERSGSAANDVIAAKEGEIRLTAALRVDLKNSVIAAGFCCCGPVAAAAPGAVDV